MSNIFDRLQLFSSVQFYFLEARDIDFSKLTANPRLK